MNELFKIGELGSGTEKLKKVTTRFRDRKGDMKCWGNGKDSFGFYKFNVSCETKNL